MLLSVIMVFMKSQSLFVESTMSWVYEYNPETKSFCNFLYNENPTRALNTASPKCCLPSTNVIDRREKNSRMYMKVQGQLMKTHLIEIHQVFAEKDRYFSNRVIVTKTQKNSGKKGRLFRKNEEMSG